MRIRRNGFVLLAALLLVSLFLIMGMGFLAQRRGQQEAVAASRLHFQARELARTGLETTLVRLAKRHEYPPAYGPGGQETYSYSEFVTDYDGNRLGNYKVRVHYQMGRDPYFLVRITSRGQVGVTDSARAQAILHAEVDIAEYVRDSDPPVPNPNRFKILSIREETRFE
jgi:hypothetical protein